MKEQPEKFQINTFYEYANEYNKNITEEDKIEKIDMTEIFYAELEEMIKNKEIIIIQLNGKPRLGKSTTAIKLGQHIFKLLQKYGYQTRTATFGMNNIARDQQEKSKLMRDENTQFTIIVTDESNELEKGGENSTAEHALNKVFSDLHAGRYVHGINCAPNELIDENTDIILEVIGTDKKRAITHTKLYYRLLKGGNINMQLLGYVNIHVGDLIQKWEKVKQHFLKPNKTRTDQEIIEKTAETDFYTKYMIEKYQKMELITKEGIFRPRILDYAEVILVTVDKLKKLCKLGNILNINIAKNYVKMEMRNRKIPQSLVGEEISSREVMGILDLYKALHKLNGKINQLDEQHRTGQLNDEQHTIQRHSLEETQKEINNAIQLQITELERYKEINKEYHKRT